MRRSTIIIVGAVAIAAVVLVAYLVGLPGSNGASYNPLINPEDFVEEVDNPFFPLVPGTAYVYVSYSGIPTSTSNERNEVVVTNQTRVVIGVTCTVVWDRVWQDGSLVEETYDWYAQDEDGNVWYFGEDSKEIEHGIVVSTEGSWEAGVDGARPGIIMMGHPVVGEEYRQEFYKGEAEDMARVMALNKTVITHYGTFANCLQTKEWTPLEHGSAESKYYAPGIGLIIEVDFETGTEGMELESW